MKQQSQIMKQQSQRSPKKFHRLHRRGDALDKINDQLFLDSPDGCSVHLHPTKGFRDISDKRMLAIEGRPAMLRVFWATLQRAQKNQRGKK